MIQLKLNLRKMIFDALLMMIIQLNINSFLLRAPYLFINAKYVVNLSLLIVKVYRFYFDYKS